MFLKKKPSNVMIVLLDKDMYISELAKKADSTYVYVTNLVSSLVSKGLVEIIPKGKFRIARLTEKGREIALLLKKVKEKEEA